MHRNRRWRITCATLALAGMVQPLAAAVAQPGDDVTIGPQSSDMVWQHTRKHTQEPLLSRAEKLRLLQQNVKYVFVLFQENRSFDFHLGTFPGANGLFSQPPGKTPGFNQPIVDIDGSLTTITPFLITQTVTDVNGNTVPLYPSDTDSVDHSHIGIDNSLDVLNGVAANDRYSLN